MPDSALFVDGEGVSPAPPSDWCGEALMTPVSGVAFAAPLVLAEQAMLQQVGEVGGPCPRGFQPSPNTLAGAPHAARPQRLLQEPVAGCPAEVAQSPRSVPQSEPSACSGPAEQSVRFPGLDAGICANLHSLLGLLELAFR